MTVALQVFLLVGGLAVALVASDRAVAHTRSLAAALGAPPFIVGVALVSIGTDLPEIANSVASHVQGEGDVNVGDSVGSTLTQMTLVLGLFPFLAGALTIRRRQVGLVRVLPGHAADDPPAVATRTRARQALVVLVALGFVGFGATVAVRALVRLAELVGVPEFAIAFFGASLGTSAPEVMVDVTALLRGAPGIALGDAVGSSLVDATLSIGVGPVVAPAEVTPRLGVVGSLYTLGAVLVVGALLVARRRHDRLSAVVLMTLYALSYVVVIR